MAEIIPILGSGVDSNAFLIVDEKAVLIDAGAGLDERIANEVKSRLGKQKLDFIINTHAHFDHCGGNKNFNAKVYVHRDDARELISGRFYGTHEFFGDEIKPTKFHKLIQNGDKLELGEIILEVLHTPGHTFGSICLYEEDKKILFSGDTLFPDGSFGRVDIGGNAEHLLNSLKKLATIDFDALYSGHGRVVNSGKEHLKFALANAATLF